MPASFRLNRLRTAASVTGSAASRFPLTGTKNMFPHIGSEYRELLSRSLFSCREKIFFKHLMYHSLPIYPFHLPCLINPTTCTAGALCPDVIGELWLTIRYCFDMNRVNVGEGVRLHLQLSTLASRRFNICRMF